MQERILAVVALLLALAIAALALLWHPQPAPRELPRPGLPAGGDFVLDSAAGKLALADLRGKVVALAFGYTACPDICPTTLLTLADVIAQLEPGERERAAFLFVSVDPARDTPQHLASYTAFFNPAIAGPPPIRRRWPRSPAATASSTAGPRAAATTTPSTIRPTST